MATTTERNEATAKPTKFAANVLETLKSKFEIPGVACDLLEIHSAETAREGAKAIDAAATKAIATFETKARESVDGLINGSRTLQAGLIADINASPAPIEKLASAKTLSEAAQIQSEFIANRIRTGLDRAKSFGEMPIGATRSNLNVAKKGLAFIGVTSGQAAQ